MTDCLRRPLSPREWQVARLVGKGKSYCAIGDELNITEGTARVHVNNIVNQLPWNFNRDLKPYRRVMLWVIEHGKENAA